MSTTVSALDVRHMREQYRRNTQEIRRNYARIAADKHYTDEGRKAALAPLATQLTTAHDALHYDIAALVSHVEATIAHDSPDEVRGRAAAKDPVSAAQTATFAKLENAKGLLALATTLAAEKDDAAAHGLALAMRSREDLTPEERKAILTVLDAPHLPAYSLAVARTVGVKTELARHDAEGPFGDLLAGVLKDPVRGVVALREAQSYTDAGGEVRYLSDAQAAALVDAAGVAADIGQPAPAAPRLTVEDALRAPAALFDAANVKTADEAVSAKGADGLTLAERVNALGAA